MIPKCYDIPNLFDSLAADVVSGKITMEEAACELNRCNYTPYIDIERTQKILAPYIARVNAKKGVSQ